MSPADFTAADLRQLEAMGISAEEARRQLELLRHRPPPVHLARPARLGDGIVELQAAEHGELLTQSDRAVAGGRVQKVVPASGAASRMFRSLRAVLESGEATPQSLERRAEAGERAAADTLRFFDQRQRFAFYPDLAAAVERDGGELEAAVAAGDYLRLLDVLLTSRGLDYDHQPKALIRFHSYEQERRTAFDEHLVESTSLVRDAGAVCRAHFTVLPEHQEAFDAALDAARPRLEGDGARLQIGFSHQSPATSTVALDEEGNPFRLDGGQLLLRPGGHGALLHNLQQLRGDLVLVKNIDNVLREEANVEAILWQRLLLGHLVRLQSKGFALLRRLESGDADSELLAEGLDFTARELFVPAARRLLEAATEEQRAFLVDRLRRPLRVCGMVVNEGEPGGGPFWVEHESGELSLQIVEGSQIHTEDEDQRQILQDSTHFNPVLLALGLSDPEGEPYHLPAFHDPATAFITTKPHAGRTLTALEHPGLWNGAMAGWNTVFVEVPASTFAPVKTVLDLLRPQHQP